MRMALRNNAVAALLGAVVGGLASLGGAWYQSRNAIDALRVQIAAEDARRLAVDERRRIAIAAVMVADLTDLQGSLGAWRQRLVAGQISTTLAAHAAIPTNALTKWTSEELSLLERQMLRRIGIVRLDTETFVARLRAAGLSSETGSSTHLSADIQESLRDAAALLENRVQELSRSLLAIAALDR